MNIYPNVLDMVGRTPMLEVRKLDTGPCRLFLKLELMNPGGSIKDRIGISMIAAAEKRGDLKPGDTIVEPTSGNTGIGLAMAAAVEHLSEHPIARAVVEAARARGALHSTRSDYVRSAPARCLHRQDARRSVVRRV